TDDPLQPRATDEEVRNLIVSDLEDAIAVLPSQANVAYGKATIGAARATLMTFYMNTKQWQLAANVAGDIISSGQYDLQETYESVFSLDNEGNSEMIYASTKVPAGPASNINALIFPNLSGKFPFPYPNNSAFAAQTYLFDDFVDSFDPNDSRKDLIITEWTNTDGVAQQAYGFDKSFPAKYPFDPAAIGASDGNDWPIYRYSDVLLSRAEALNEVSGPTQEIIDLINEVRGRAGAPDLTLAGYTKDSLRDAIIQERKWEFWLEGKSRELELRHDLFISNAVARGKNAEAYRALYPIPQVELDANPDLEQNPGY
ncbi:MAG: RagB/SusD family nutrient uptake outer membrane protein, partial [Bacteroidota bacterium]|nr:RagB/SusD family nutrient uptake outer membrane protein [Bacteroidota bacterium]